MVTLLPTSQSDRDEFNTFRRSDMVTLFIVMLFMKVLTLFYEIIRFMITFEEFDKLTFVLAHIIILAVGVALNSRYTKKYVYVACAAYAI